MGQDVAKKAGMSDEKVRQKTGHDWREWCAKLDEIGALTMAHREMTREIHARWPEVGMWWTQTLAVGYERIRGLRALGEMRANGTFSASKSRTFGVPVCTLFAAFEDAGFREMWMPASFEIRHQVANKTIRFDHGSQRVIATFSDKGAKSSVAIEHLRLADDAERVLAKTTWAERFDCLERHLEHQMG